MCKLKYNIIAVIHDGATKKESRMFITKDDSIKAVGFPSFRDQVFAAYRDAAETNEISSVQYDEVDEHGDVISSGSICIDPECHCTGNW